VQFGGPFPYAGPLATAENISSLAPALEKLGYDFVIAGDHLLYPKELRTPYPGSTTGALPIDPRRNHLEVLATLAFVAGLTTRLRVHSGVLVLPYRTPFVTAKFAATIDHLSGGRFTLGVGVGWMKDEFDVLGVPFEERGDLTDEYLTILRALFEGDGPFEGRYFRFPELHFAPRPVQQPLPIWIGGAGPRALRRVARFGQGWLPTTDPVPSLPLLRELLENEGRAGADVDIVYGVPVLLPKGQGTPEIRDRTIDEVSRLAKAGVTSIVVGAGELKRPSLGGVIDAATWFAEEVMPEVRGL
jgi:probable F420-dependent oxidoreductase